MFLAPEGPQVVAAGGAMHSIAEPVEAGSVFHSAPAGRIKAPAADRST
jgi:hypothetical protein